MKTFQLINSPPLPELKSEMIDGKRYYTAPTGEKLPSVTTVLGHFEKAGIMKWKKRVGEEEAKKVSSQATRRGTKIHSLAEDYVQNIPIDYDALMPQDKVNFIRFQKSLDNIDNIHYIEAPLFSVSLGLAGRTDLIAEYNGVLSIIDHKTSTKVKKEEYIQHYFEQETAYALMYYHMTGIPISQIVILMSVDDHPEPLVFIKQTKDFIVPLKDKIRKYKELNS